MSCHVMPDILPGECYRADKPTMPVATRATEYFPSATTELHVASEETATIYNPSPPKCTHWGPGGPEVPGGASHRTPLLEICRLGMSRSSCCGCINCDHSYMGGGPSPILDNSMRRGANVVALCYIGKIGWMCWAVL